eukprot:IDg14829t1
MLWRISKKVHRADTDARAAERRAWYAVELQLTAEADESARRLTA